MTHSNNYRRRIYCFYLLSCLLGILAIHFSIPAATGFAASLPDLSLDTSGLIFGETFSGEISIPAEVDSYTIDLLAGDYVLVRMTNYPDTSLEPQLALHRPDDSQLCATLTVITSTITLHCQADVTGTHTLLAYDDDGLDTGTYYLHVQRTNNPGQAVPLNMGDTISGTVELAAQMDAYTFELQNGDNVLMRIADFPATDLEPRLALYRPDGSQLCATLAFTSGTVMLNCQADATGTHTLLAYDDFGFDIGTYHLHVQRTNNPGQATPIHYGEETPGAINLPAELDSHFFTGETGDEVLFTVTEIITTTLEPILRVYRPDGTQLCSAIGSAIAQTQCQLDSSGVHVILVGQSDGYIGGPYTLEVSCVVCPNAVQLQLTVQADPEPAAVGYPLTYTTMISNQAMIEADNVILVNTLPSGIGFGSTITSQGSCSENAQIITCTIGSINLGSPVTVTFAVTPTDPGFITYTAEVSADQNDAFWPDNTALLTSTILTPAVGITSQINVGDVSSSDIVLSWTHMVENHTYEIHRNQAPYFTPDSTTLIASLPAPTDTYTDTDILATATSAYYIIRVRNGPTTADGDELGAFVFSIIPGDN